MSITTALLFSLQIARFGSWRLDIVGDEPSCSIVAMAEDERTGLAVRYVRGTTYVMVVAAEDFDGRESFSGRHAFDDGAAIEAEWRVGISHRAAILDEGVTRFVAQLRKASRFTFEAEGLEAVFGLTETEAALNELYRRCR